MWTPNANRLAEKVKEVSCTHTLRYSCLKRLGSWDITQSQAGAQKTTE